MSEARAVSPALAALAGALGVELEYWQATGEHRVATPEHLTAILGSLGVELASPGAAEAALAELEAARAAVEILAAEIATGLPIGELVVPDPGGAVALAALRPANAEAA